MIRETTDDIETGISVGGHIINTSYVQMTRHWWLTARTG